MGIPVLVPCRIFVLIDLSNRDHVETSVVDFLQDIETKKRLEKVYIHVVYIYENMYRDEAKRDE